MLFATYIQDLKALAGVQADFQLSGTSVLAGLFVGAMIPFLFASLAMEAVGRVGGEVVVEVRRQFRENPGIMEGTVRPEYGRAIDIVTGSAIKSMLAPALIPIVFPIVVGLINAQPMGFYPPASLVRDGQRRGVEVRPPDVNGSGAACSLEPVDGGFAVRVGVGYIRSVGEDEAGALVAERGRGGPFAGEVIFTTGRLLPTTIGKFCTTLAPCASVTVRRAVVAPMVL